jgi:acetyl-CoA synthetase (ADP-forming)
MPAMTYGSMERLLGRYNIALAASRTCAGEGQCSRAAAQLGFPVALKVLSPDILHKTDAGCIALNVRESELAAQYRRIMKNAAKSGARTSGVLVQRMAQPGIELIVGAKRDPQFGSVVLFGLGGIFVEALRDVSMRVCPVDKHEAQRMLFEIKGAALLRGARGVRVDAAAVAELITRVSRLMLAEQRVTEVDLNPVIAHAKGYTIVDARVLT